MVPGPRPSQPPQRPAEPTWFDVVELMDYFARLNGDEILYAFARTMGDLVDDHYNGPQGCEECAGGETVDGCRRWLEGQSNMLGWLIDRAVQ